MYFIIGVVFVILFLIGTSGIFLLVPSLALKGILTIGVGMCCILAFQWLVPEFTSGGTRESVEADIKDLYDGVVEIGQAVEFDLLRDYRHNKWLNAQREKHESGFYEDNNGTNYYNAVQDKEYYKLPNGQWQETGLSHTPIGNPFETPAWKPVTAIGELTGYWAGSNKISFPAVKDRNPAFTAVFTVTLERNGDLVDIGFKLDLESYLESLIAAYPRNNPTKDGVWALFTENSETQTDGIEYGKYYISMFQKGISPETILENCSVLKNDSGTKIKLGIPNKVFGISATDNLDCILEKKR